MFTHNIDIMITYILFFSFLTTDNEKKKVNFFEYIFITIFLSVSLPFSLFISLLHVYVYVTLFKLIQALDKADNIYFIRLKLVFDPEKMTIHCLECFALIFVLLFPVITERIF